MALSLSRAKNLIGNHVEVPRGDRALGNVLADLGSALAPHEVLSLLEESLKQPVRFVESARACSENDLKEIRQPDAAQVFIPVKMRDVVRGYLIVDATHLSQADMGLLVLAGRVLAACLWEQEPTGKTWDAILNCGQVSSGEVQRVFTLRGWPPVCRISVFAARPEASLRAPKASNTAPRDLDERAEDEHWTDHSDVLGGQGRRLVFARQDLFAVFVAVKPEDSEEIGQVAAGIHQDLCAFASGRVTIGIGGTADSLCSVPSFWKRAYDVLCWGEVFVGRDAVVSYDMLGMLGALLDHVPESAPQEYVKSRLQPLLAYDEREGTDLYRTLVAFVECGGNRVETARRLFVHYNTLRHRLHRIEELVGADFSHPVSSLDLSLCVHVASLYPITSRKV